ncbi:Gfo/Idh/MocA family protein [Piscinibacter sp.]|uniref:Gfo/Idh/MocA family protein n=1 Tax=Piscinibacter sp. TaxID=1903157 RepID=UPI0039E31A5F
MTQRRLKVGLVGCGKIADGHIEQVRALGRADVVAVCDSEPLMAEQLATRLGIPARYDNLVRMLDEQKLDVLHVATPPDSHRAIATLAFERGCHVFMEKPFALDEAEAKLIVDAAAAAGRRVGVNYLYNYETPGLELERLVTGGELGSIVHLESHYGYNLAGDYGIAVMSDPRHWVHRLPGKLFHNVLDHVLAKIVPHIGDDFELQAISLRRRQPIGVDVVDAMPDELRFMLSSGSVTASGLVSAHGRPVAHTLKVFGERDSVELDYMARTLVHASRWAQPSALGRLFPAFVQARQHWRGGWANVGRFRRHEYHYFQCMRVLLDRFYDAVEGKGADPVPVDQILRVCRIIDRIVEVTGRKA